MGLPYRLSDGTVVFVTPEDPENPPSVEEVEADHLATLAQDAARDPEAIAFGEAFRTWTRAKGIHMLDVARQIEVTPSRVSDLYRGRAMPTDKERAAIQAMKRLYR